VILNESTVTATFAKNVAAIGVDAVVRHWKAAEGYVADRAEWPATDAAGLPIDPPAQLGEAVELLTRRLLARVNSPDGLVQGATEYGPVRIPTTDRDVDRLIFPWRRMVLA